VNDEEKEETKEEQTENDLIENLHKKKSSNASNEKEKNKNESSNNNSITTALETTLKQNNSTVKLLARTASKQYLIKKPPKILTIHLKRFMQLEDHLQKIDIHVSFPTMLDLTPFATSEAQNLRLKYNLYGVVEHSGGLSGGHYVAYVRTKRSTDSEGFLFVLDFCVLFEVWFFM
jgi:hypothetical protein